MQVGDLSVKIGLDMSALKTSLAEARNSIQQVERQATSSFGRIGDAIKSGFGFAAGFAGFQGIVDGIKSVVNAGVQFDASMQQNQIAFTQMLGSAQKAQAMLQELTQFAASTPFELPQVEDAAKKLLAFGFQAQQIKPMLTAIGDAAAGLGLGAAGVDRITIALGQMQAKGKVAGDEMLQLVEAGIPAWDILSKAMGVPTAQLQKMVSDGAIPADKAIQALISGMEQRFPNMMNAQSKSFTGLMSNLKDNMNITFGQIMRPTFEWLTNTALPKLVQMTTQFSNAFKSGGWSEALKTIMPAGAADTIILVGNALKDLFNFIKANSEPIKAALIGVGAAFIVFKGYKEIQETIVAIKALRIALIALTTSNPILLAVSVAIGLIAAAAYEVYTHWGQIKNFLMQTWQTISTTAQTVWGGISNFFSNVWNGVTTAAQTAWNGVVSAVTNAWDGIKNAFQSIWSNIAPIVTAGWESIKSIFTAYIQTIGQVIQAGWETIKVIFATAILVIKDIVTGNWGDIGNVFQAAGEKFASIISNMWNNIKAIWAGAIASVIGNVTSMWTYISGQFSAAWGKLVQFVSNLWNGIKSAFSSGVQSAISFISNMWNSIVSFFQSAPGRVLGALQSLWSTITSTFRSIASDAASAGADIVRGLINGIQNLAGWAEQKIKEFFGNVVQWAKKVLGIASPSRVFAEIGAFVAEGFAKGISDNTAQATTAADSMARASIQASAEVLAQYNATIQSTLAKGMEENQRLAEQAAQAEAAAAAAKTEQAKQNALQKAQDLRAKMQSEGALMGAAIKAAVDTAFNGLDTRLNEIKAKYDVIKAAMGENASQSDTLKNTVASLSEQIAIQRDRVALLQKAFEDVRKAEGDTGKETADIAQKYAQEAKALSDMTNQLVQAQTQLQAQAWRIDEAKSKLEVLNAEYERAQALLDLNGTQLDKLVAEYGYTSEKMDQQREIIAVLRAEYESLADAKGADAEETRKAYIELVNAETEEAKLQDELAKTTASIKDQADELASLADQASQVARKMNDDLIAAEQDYEQKVADLNAKLASDISKAWDDFENQVEQRANSLKNFVGLFDSVDTTPVSGTELLRNLQAQVNAFEDWQANIAELSKRGVDDGLIAELKQMGPKAAPQIKALTTLTDDQLKQYVALWKQKSQDARQQAESELEQQRIDTINKIAELRAQAEQQLEQYRIDWAKKNEEIRKNAMDEMQKIEDRYKQLTTNSTQYGQSLVENFISGIRSRFDALRQTLEEMAATVDAYMPHSPAKVGPLKRLGEWGPALVQTFADGITASLPQLEAAVNGMAALTPTALQPIIAGTTTNTTTTNNSTVVNINVTGGATARSMADELMRELRKRGVRI